MPRKTATAKPAAPVRRTSADLAAIPKRTRVHVHVHSEPTVTTTDKDGTERTKTRPGFLNRAERRARGRGRTGMLPGLLTPYRTPDTTTAKG